MATFHPFPRLPLELRIQIWASVFEDNRVVKVRSTKQKETYWSPTPIPAVTKACRESRKYCSYKQFFFSGDHPNFIWVDFDRDILQMLCVTLALNVEQARTEIFQIRRLRIEMATETQPDDQGYHAEFFYHYYSHQISELPKLEACDVLVVDGLRHWGDFIADHYWGACPKSNVRMVDAKTGEWFDMNTEGPYIDWMDNLQGVDPDYGPSYTRIPDFWDEEDKEDVKNRYDAMMKMKEDGLPRIDLNY